MEVGLGSTQEYTATLGHMKNEKILLLFATGAISVGKTSPPCQPWSNTYCHTNLERWSNPSLVGLQTRSVHHVHSPIQRDQTSDTALWRADTCMTRDSYSATLHRVVRKLKSFQDSDHSVSLLRPQAVNLSTNAIILSQLQAVRWVDR